MKKFLILIPLTLIVLLSGCSSDNSNSGEKYKNSEKVDGLVYMAMGTQGDGPDDAIVNVASTKSNPEETKDVNTILPWTKTVKGTAGEKVSMTVESLSSDGTVECQIMFDDIIIYNKASGNNVTVTCEGTLDLK